MATAGAVGAAALLLVLGISVATMMRGRHHPASPDTGAPRSLQVELGHEDPGLDPQRPLRCFVGGQYVGEITLKQCAQKNGVSTGALDVGRDTSGQLAAASDASPGLQPLPSAPSPPQGVAQAAPSGPDLASHAACWRFSGDWKKLSEDLTLDACVQALFSGQCQQPGAADYGRWGADTLRLVVGRVEWSADNKSFRVLVKQPPGDCAIPHLTE
jgi:hypothetical protein